MLGSRTSGNQDRKEENWDLARRPPCLSCRPPCCPPPCCPPFRPPCRGPTFRLPPCPSSNCHSSRWILNLKNGKKNIK